MNIIRKLIKLFKRKSVEDLIEEVIDKELEEIAESFPQPYNISNIEWSM